MPPSKSSPFWAGVLAVCSTLVASSSLAANPYLDLPRADEMLASPAYRYANASNDEIRAWLREREVPFVEESSATAGVRLPGRLRGPLHGVWIHGTDKAHAESIPYEILDGRLALALDDLCEMLAESQVVELVHFTMYRPSLSAKAAAPYLTRHSGALAIDVGSVKLADGTWLRVKKDWSPSPGAKTCGSGERIPESESGKRLHGWVCEARHRGIFHYALTPHFDAAHADHLHLEIKPNVKWFLYN